MLNLVVSLRYRLEAELKSQDVSYLSARPYVGQGLPFPPTVSLACSQAG